MPTQEELVREIRRVKRWAIGATIGVVVLAVVALAPRQDGRFDELTVRRLNVVEPDGQPTLVLANSQRIPAVMCEGQAYVQTRKGAGGMIFFDGHGTEVGGMIFGLKRAEDGGYSASRHLSFDRQFDDQTIVLSQSEDADGMTKALRFVDRTAEIDGCQFIETASRLREGDSAQQAAARRWFEEHYRGGKEVANRVVLGVDHRNAVLVLAGTDGRPRIRMVVDTASAARLEFLDADGRVVESLPGDER